METKKLPTGIDSFSKLREQDFYYVDKTGLIKELLTNWGEVNLFTRPRRFGKTLNMDMISITGIFSGCCAAWTTGPSLQIRSRATGTAIS